MFESPAIAIVPDLYTSAAWGLCPSRPERRHLRDARPAPTRPVRRWLTRLGLVTVAVTAAFAVSVPLAAARDAEVAADQCMATACRPALTLDGSLRVLEP